MGSEVRYLVVLVYMYGTGVTIELANPYTAGKRQQVHHVSKRKKAEKTVPTLA